MSFGYILQPSPRPLCWMGKCPRSWPLLIVDMCVVHIGVGNPWFFCLVTGGRGSPRYFYIITDYAIIPFFQNAGILQLSKHCLLLLLREKMLLLSFMHLGFFTYLTDFAFFPDIYKWRLFQASALSLNK